MKVIVLYENTAEKTRAENLVDVLKAIGAVLVYGKVTDTGVLLEDWQSKPRTNIKCVAGPAPSMQSADVVKYGVDPKPLGSYGSYSYVGMAQAGPETLGITREFARDLVKMFPDSIEAKRKKTKPVVPKPDTTETGVTVRELDMWDEDDHE